MASRCPGAVLLRASMSSLEPAMYPPAPPNDLVKVPVLGGERVMFFFQVSFFFFSFFFFRPRKRKRFHNLTHHHVDVARVNPERLANPSPRLPQRADRVRLVQIQIRAVPLAHGDDLGQRRQLPLHRVDPFDDDEDLLPGPARARLPARDAGAQGALERVDVVVGEHRDLGAGPARAAHYGGVVERVRDDQAAGAGEHGQDRRVGRKAHAEAERGRLPQKRSQLALEVQVQLRRAGLSPRRARGPPFFLESLERARRAVGVVRGKAQVIITAQVERSYFITGQLQRPLPSHGRALEHVDVRVGRGRDRPVPAVVDAVEHAARVKVLVVLAHGHEPPRERAPGPGEEVAEEVADVAEQEEEGPAACFGLS